MQIQNPISELDLGTFSAKYLETQGKFEIALKGFLAVSPLKGHLLEVAKYSLFPGGKRFRPVLALSVAQSLNLPLEKIAPYSIALELIHTSSLIHDDLPALDDDELRRGRSTAHVKFNEAQAILAGDALIALAFSAVSSCPSTSNNTKAAWLEQLSCAVIKLCEGQSLDIAEMRGEVIEEDDFSDPQHKLSRRHQLKTGTLIEASVCGPLALLADDKQRLLRPILSDFANKLGLLFQVTDDILDYQELEKSSVSADLQESTFVSLLGVEGSKDYAAQLNQQALLALEQLDFETEFLAALTSSIARRS